MPDARRRAPLIFGLVTALAMVAAILAFVLVDDDPATSGGSNTYTSSEQAAIEAAQTNVANVFSYRRASFEADYQRAVRGLTGSVVNDIKRNKAPTLKAMTAGKYDLSVKITHAALIGPVDDDKVKGYEFLVSFNGFQSTNLNAPAQTNLRVTVVDKGGKWLISEIQSVGVTS